MFRKKKVMLDSLIEAIRCENQLACLSIEQIAQAKGLTPIEPVCLEEESILTTEMSEIEDSVEATTPSQRSEGGLEVIERGLYAVAGSILIFAVVYLGTYLHQTMTATKEVPTTSPTIESTQEVFSYEISPTPYRGEGLHIQTMPYELEQYFLQSLFGE